MQSPARTDAAALVLLGEGLTRRRLSQNRTQADLAREAGVSKRTLVRMEAGHSTQVTNLVRVLRCLGMLEELLEILPDGSPSPLEQLRGRRKPRQRASRRGAGELSEPNSESAPGAGSNSGWAWGEGSPS